MRPTFKPNRRKRHKTPWFSCSYEVPGRTESDHFPSPEGKKETRSLTVVTTPVEPTEKAGTVS